MTPANGSANTSPDTFTGVKVTSSGTLDPATVVAANVTLKAGGITAVPGAIAVAADKRSFALTPSVKIGYGQSYTFAASALKDSAGNAVASAMSTFTTASIACAAPQVPSTDGQSCVTPPFVWGPIAVVDVNTQITTFQLPATCYSADQDCFKQAVAAGELVTVASGGTDTINPGRKINWVCGWNSTNVFGPGGEWFCIPLYADDGSVASNVSPTYISGGVASQVDWVKGTKGGIIRHDKPSDTCWQWLWDNTYKSWDNNGTGAGTPVPCSTL